MPECAIGPSVLNADLANLSKCCSDLVDAGADYLHLDVMDGHFVPNLTFGAPVVAALRKQSEAFFDMHMMVSKPEQWVGDMAKAGADQFTFHLESTADPKALIAMIRKAGMKVGVGIKPGTDVDSVLPLADMVDMVLVMTVEPGFGGQKFMANMMPKVSVLRNRFSSLNIQVDGGLSPATIDRAAEAGANWIVSGSAIVKSDDPAKVIAVLRARVKFFQDGKRAPKL